MDRRLCIKGGATKANCLLTAMFSIINRLKNGLTPAIRWSAFGTALGGISGPTVAVLIAKNFTLDAQGYYYTFNSVLALSVLFELGFNYCITQFISSEYANLKLESGLLHPSGRSLQRLAMLYKLSVKWYSIASIILFFGVGVFGELFFRQHISDIGFAWRFPWWCLCFLTSFNLLLLPISALLEGCDQLTWLLRSRTMQNLIRSGVLIVSLSLGFGLYSPAIALLCSTGIIIFLYWKNWRRLLRQLFGLNSAVEVSWRREILPMQWRLAVSWASGYFVFFVMGPIIFAFAGAEQAGRFGMTWSFLSAINAIAQAFVNTKRPRFSILTTQGSWSALYKEWKLSVVSAVAVYILGAGCLLVLIFALNLYRPEYGGRLLGGFEVALFALAGVGNQIAFAVAIIARAELKEPFMWVTIVAAMLTTGGALLMIDGFGIRGVAISYLAGASFGAISTLLYMRRMAVYREGRGTL